jgi:hypothetical protein
MKFIHAAATLIMEPDVFPQGIEFDAEKNIYLTSGLKIFKYTPSLRKTVFIDRGKSIKGLALTDMKFDAGYKNLYVTNYAMQQMYKYPINSDGSAGEQITAFDGNILREGLGDQKPGWYSLLQNAHASWFSMDSSGNIYVSVENIYSILKIGTDDSYTMYEIDSPFFNSTIAFGKGDFDNASLYTPGYDDGYIHKLTFVN